MSTNLTRYEADLKRLVQEGERLFTGMQYEQHPEEVAAQIKDLFGEKSDSYIKSLPRFSSEYQKWYSEAKALIRQLIPDRLADFVRHYERQTNRKMLQWDNYTIEDYLQRLSRSDAVTMRAGLSRLRTH